MNSEPPPTGRASRPSNDWGAGPRPSGGSWRKRWRRPARRKRSRSGRRPSTWPRLRRTGHSPKRAIAGCTASRRGCGSTRRRTRTRAACEYRRGFRFGQLRVARARSVAYELRILIPEAEAHKAELASVGVNDGFIAEAKEILGSLAADQQETAGARATREAATRAVRESEGRLSDLLHRIELADEAAALQTPEAHRWFTLDIIAAERGRTEAAYQARVAARPPDAPGPDEAEA